MVICMANKLTFKQELRVLRERYWPSNLTFFGKIRHYNKKIWNVIKEIDVFCFTGVFMAIILQLYMPLKNAIILGIVGYFLYLRFEQTLINISVMKRK